MPVTHARPDRPLAGPPLVATYRLQLRPGFGFAEARDLVPHLRRLGVSHLYLSPVLTARAGSQHGYDVVDPSCANPALGGEAGFDALAESARAHGMGIVLDVVPNHMGTGADNPYWDDVLAWGSESPYARWFDVAWEHLARIGHRQLVLPILGDPIEDVLARGELKLELDARGLRVRYWDHAMPVDPRTAHRAFTWQHTYEFPDDGRADAAEVALLRDAMIPEMGASLSRGDAERAVRALAERAARVPAIGAYVRWVLERFAEGEDGRYRLQALLDLQHWRATHWRRAWRELNYRRFFDITDLVGLRAEDPAVFHATHEWMLARVAAGQVHGVRVDHVDGLRDPLAYLQRLRAALDARAPGGAHVPVWIEKILMPHEHLRPEWPVDGTTGYEALNELEAVFIDAAGFSSVERAYRGVMRLRGPKPGFPEMAVRGKELVLRTAFRPEVRRAVRALARVARAEGVALAPPQLADAVLRLAAALPVYRTYVTAEDGPGGLHVVAADEDRRLVAWAVERARGRLSEGGDPHIVDALHFVRDVLLGDRPGPAVTHRVREAAVEFALRFQQTSGPATAKGIEDTALYRYAPLASLNEVGGEPDRVLENALTYFHDGSTERAKHFPRALVTVTTHDTKRTADARARLDALAEHAERWNALVRRWRRRHAPLRPRVPTARGEQAAPDANLEYLVYQSVVALWPAGEPHRPPGERRRLLDGATRAALRDRVAAYAEKAGREAKTHTSWIDQEPAFEQAVRGFVDALLCGGEGTTFRREVAALVSVVEPAARRTTLARTALHLLAPGTPDLYQGDELRFLALVDPDNRRAVDFAERARLLELGDAHGDDRAAADPLDLAKLRLVRAGLRLRQAHPALFAAGAHVPLRAEGPRADDVVAFARTGEDGAAVLVVVVRRGPDAGWEGTALPLLPPLTGRTWRDALGSDGGAAVGDRLDLAAALADRPIAVYHTQAAG